MNMQLEPKTIGHCVYCKGKILETDDYAHKDNNLYCLFCFNQIDTYIEDFPE